MSTEKKVAAVESRAYGLRPYNVTTTLPVKMYQHNIGGTIYFFPTPNNTQQQQQWQQRIPIMHNGQYKKHYGHDDQPHPNVAENLQAELFRKGNLYAGAPANIASMKCSSHMESLFLKPEELRAEILSRNQISNRMLNPHESKKYSLPIEVDKYRSLFPLETLSELSMQNINKSYITSTYRVTQSTSGFKYCMRRLHDFRLQSTKCVPLINMWKKLQHIHVVQLYQVFTSKAFQDSSLILIYHYYPDSQTLLEKYFTTSPNDNTSGYNKPLLPEETIWLFVIQLISGLRAIHMAGLACRTLNATKIIQTGNCLRFSFCGINDITNFSGRSQLQVHQQEDLTALGHLVLALACRSLQTNIEIVAQNYSKDLYNLINYLLRTPCHRSIDYLLPIVGNRFTTQLNILQTQLNVHDHKFSREMENGRLYRILVKLNLIRELSDFSHDTSWSETGDKYMLNLFFEYVFHSITDDARPKMNYAHIIQCLSKLDAGTKERIKLISRDQKTIQIATYAELKTSLESTFSKLINVDTERTNLNR